MSGRLTKVTWKILNGAATSNAVDLSEHRLLAIKFPAALTQATFTFTSSVNNNLATPSEAADPFAAVVDDTSATISLVTIAAADYVLLDADQVNGLMFTKLVAGGNEAADRVIFGIVEPRGI